MKRYIVKDMPEAMEKIRRELGSDAMILSSKSVRRKGLMGYFSKRLLEVMAAYEPPSSKANRAEQKPVEEPKAEAPERTEVGSKKIDQLSSQLEELKNAVEVFTEKIVTVDRQTTLKYTPPVMQIYHRLIQTDVREDLARRIAAETQQIITRTSGSAGSVANDLLADILGEPATIKLKKYKRNIIMLVGPTGVGKTTTLVKLAGLYAIDQGLKVGFINADTFRVAAKEQLSMYSEIMEIPLCTVYSPEEMEKALLAMQDRDVVLVDTAGKSTSSNEYRKEIEQYVQACETDEVLLAISASMSSSACKELISNYSFLGNYKIIITKVDEVSAWGNMINIAEFAKMPLAFVTMGQNVPYDIERPDVTKIAKRVLEGAQV
ncbi:MAG: flagellar biosynthesis protein FlhF [Bacillota bacterium]